MIYDNPFRANKEMHRNNAALAAQIQESFHGKVIAFNGSDFDEYSHVAEWHRDDEGETVVEYAVYWNGVYLGTTAYANDAIFASDLMKTATTLAEAEGWFSHTR